MNSRTTAEPNATPHSWQTEDYESERLPSPDDAPDMPATETEAERAGTATELFA